MGREPETLLTRLRRRPWLVVLATAGLALWLIPALPFVLPLLR